MQFSLEVGNILEQLIFFAVVVPVVKANEPPGTDIMELDNNEALDIPLQTLGLLSLFLLYWFHLSFSYFFSRRDTDANPLASRTSLLLVARSGRFSIHRASTAGDSYLYKLLFLQGLSLTID